MLVVNTKNERKGRGKRYDEGFKHISDIFISLNQITNANLLAVIGYWLPVLSLFEVFYTEIITR